MIEGIPVFEMEINAKLISYEISRKIIELKDGQRCQYTTIKTSPNAKYELKFDDRFVNSGIETEPSGLLISQPLTQEKWGLPAGKKPEDFMNNSEVNAISVCPTNWGWQKSAFLIKDGNPLFIKNDRESLSGQFEILALKNNKWESMNCSVENGKILESIDNISIGFSCPLILKGGQIVDLKEIIGNPRLIGDFRNVFDFGAGNKIPEPFWQLIRKIQPIKKVAGKRIIDEKISVSSQKDSLTEEEFNFLQKTIAENNLEQNFRLDKAHGKIRFATLQSLPLQRMPLFGLGYDAVGRMIVVAADGRQTGSSGATILELAEMLRNEGAVCGGLGSGGGDVAVVKKTNNGFEILNSPSNYNSETRERTTRLVPAVLTIG